MTSGVNSSHPRNGKTLLLLKIESFCEFMWQNERKVLPLGYHAQWWCNKLIRITSMCLQRLQRYRCFYQTLCDGKFCSFL